MKFRKETSGALIFCIVNAVLSVKCITYSFVTRMAGRSEKNSRDSLVQGRSISDMKNPWTDADKKIYFPFQDGTLLCADLKKGLHRIYLNENSSSYCGENKSDENEEMEIIILPTALHVDKDEELSIYYSSGDPENIMGIHYENGKPEYRFKWNRKTSFFRKKISEKEMESAMRKAKEPYTVILLLDNGRYGLFSRKNVLDRTPIILTSHLMRGGNKSSSAGLWGILKVPAFLFDAVTYPVQVVIVFIYIAFFGLKK